MKKQKNTLTKITIIALFVVVLAILVLANTYAKYTSNVNGTASAAVAKWDFKVKNGETELKENFKISLTDTATNAVDGKIQPGSKGEFKLTVVNNGDVPANFTAAVEKSGASIFKSNQFNVTVDGGTAQVPAGSTQDVTINWEWLYEVGGTSSDADDTSIGTAATGEATDLLTITVTGTQANPNE